ncbi:MULTISPECIES: hypothetical protein [Providencia]|uniref:hypothetical protein n=1 Tax=Providencia TaxID=586 RepID=UPI00029BCDAD|nr:MULTISPECIES: hypothetical protein [Providencia]EKT60474.1 hypothetical protein OOC_00575 [Providencia rettgeri Dmel1]EJD6476118.1 hypothetical protein [Providencia rettgeri]ELH9584562.1 hypothetical protein [Providencia rettgeri]ELM3937912.1 hypothetical protein [Providencia rettgeri]ELR5066045.1 hypothetical protein [Providencia rettgeri]
MKIDKTISWPIAILWGSLFLIPLFNYFPLNFNIDLTTKVIEHFQSATLIFCVFFTWFYMRPLQQKSQGMKLFWLWATIWWVTLFGRGTNWGREFFPNLDHTYFRLISITLISSLVLMLCASPLRKSIVFHLKNTAIPLWSLLLTLCAFLISDSVEHHRFLSSVFLYHSELQSLIEELYEIPLIFGLFISSLYFMKKDKPL